VCDWLPWRWAERRGFSAEAAKPRFRAGGDPRLGANFDFVVQSVIGNRRNTEGHLGDHRFKVGQSVRYSYGLGGLRRAPGSGGVYKITQLLPAEGDERLYRVKSADEPHERVAKETELERVI
jgi:hypothetical protein